jgi:hypothetical protein
MWRALPAVSGHAGVRKTHPTQKLFRCLAQNHEKVGGLRRRDACATKTKKLFGTENEKRERENLSKPEF